ncbi:MAG: ABC transporter ATP-binding protein [Flavobacteriales bacterium]
MGFLFIALGNLFNVYAPVLVRDGIDFLAGALDASQKLKAGAITADVEKPSSLQNFAAWFSSETDASIELQAGSFTSQVVHIALLLAIAYIVIYAIKGVFLFYQRQTIIVMSRYIEYDLKNEVYEHYQRLDMTFYKRNRTGDLMNRISEDVNRVRMYLGPAIMYTLSMVVLVIFCVVVMWRIDRELTLYTLSPLPFMMVAIFAVSRIMHRRNERVQAQQSKLSTMVQETISGIRVLKAFGRESHFESEFRHEGDLYKSKVLRQVSAEAAFMPVIVLLVGLSTALTIYIGAHKVMAGEITAGVIVQFVFYVNLLTWPFASVGWVTSLVQKAEASQQRINEFLKTEPAIKNGIGSERILEGEIEFRNVSYTYEESGTEAIKNVSFKTKKGERIAIVGRTGSGKSTLANLLLRMMDASGGEILVDGKALKEHHLFDYRKQIGYVPQDVFLFSETVASNIGFGADDQSQAQIEMAAKRADIHDNIMAFEKGYNTLLGERGINLSGGQKQRVSIARALAKNPRILLFDDCLSAVDTQTEENILASLDAEMRGRTSIIIAHRISSIRGADRILVLEQGSMVEEGTHEQLIAYNGLYKSLWEKQAMQGAN